MNGLIFLISAVAMAAALPTCFAFSPVQHARITTTFVPRSRTVVKAGGFEWDDPEEAFDQGVDNPFKNPSLMSGEEGMKIDPARLLGPRLNGSNLYFIGLMGSGKTSVGDVVARRMGSYNFLDTDSIIEKASGMKISDIFEKEGEEEFRKIESQILDSVHAYVRCVVSTGGGIVCRRQNWAKLQTGLVVWLDVAPEILVKRTEGSDSRPLLKDVDPLQKFKDLMEKRGSLYAQADVRIEVTEDMSEEDVADLVFRELHDFIDNNPPAWKQAKAKAQEDGLDWVQ
mmetsp:Transcript_16904/g.23496  ORF Transcript_16904/g.23496 Transcript_16904/m.23496 type:complete len:284 (-) Transcript_16904:767-1618(-)